MSPQKFKCLFGLKSSLFFNLESICKVLSIRGIKRARVWQVLESKQMNEYNMRKLSPQKIECFFGLKTSLFFNFESISAVLSIRGIKRAWVWQVLEFKQMNAYNTLLRC